MIVVRAITLERDIETESIEKSPINYYRNTGKTYNWIEPKLFCIFGAPIIFSSIISLVKLIEHRIANCCEKMQNPS